MSKSEISADPISAPIVEVLSVFEELPELRFGDLDHAALHALAEEVKTQAKALTAAEIALAQTQEAFALAQSILNKRSDQALQYARVYAADDEVLGERLAKIRLSGRTAGSKGAKKLSKQASKVQQDSGAGEDAKQPALENERTKPTPKTNRKRRSPTSQTEAAEAGAKAATNSPEADVSDVDPIVVHDHDEGNAHAASV